MSQQSREHSLLRSPAPQNNVVFFAGAQVLPSSPENCGSETSLRAISTSKTKTKEPAASTIDDVQSAMQLGGSLGASGFLNNIKVSSGGGDTSGSITDEEMFTPCAGGGTARGGADGDVDVEEGGETLHQNTSTLYVEDSRYSDANSTAFGGAAELDADTNVKYMRIDKLGEVQNALVDRGRELERLLLAHSTLEKENTRLRKQTLSTLPELQQQNEALRRKIAHGEQVVRRLVAEKTSVIADKKRLESTVMVLQQQLSHASKSYVQGGEAEMLKKHLIGMKREFLATVTTLQRESAGLKAALEEARQENKELKTERDIWR
eukprot:g18382.t1